MAEGEGKDTMEQSEKLMDILSTLKLDSQIYLAPQKSVFRSLLVTRLLI